MKMKHLLIGFCTFLTFSLLETAALAKEVNLYEQPQDKAKVVGTVDPAVGMIPIFSDKTGNWMKVGDPRNGNVGWVKSGDFASTGSTPSAISFTQHIIKDKNGQHTYELLQFGQAQPVSSQQNQQLQQQQQTIQKSLQKTMQDLNNEMQQLYQNTPTPMSNVPVHFPVVIPLIVMPGQNPPQNNQPAQPLPAKSTTKQ